MRRRCWISEDALAQLWAEVSPWRVRETGGALLGWRDHNDAVVMRVLGPGPRAKHRLHSFEPDGAWQREQGARIYRESGRTIAFIGDWHTHPLGGHKPSPQDEVAARVIAGDPLFRAPEPLSAIVARRQRVLGVYTWINGSFHEMDVLTWKAT